MVRSTYKYIQEHPGILAKAIAVGSVFPMIASADNVDSLTGIYGFVGMIGNILQTLLPLLVTLALLAFFWGLVKYLWSAGDQKARDAGKGLMIWGVIALFVMVSIWGLTQVIGRLFGVDNQATTTDYSNGQWRNGGGVGGVGGIVAPPPPA